jgi:hypothetical protein
MRTGAQNEGDETLVVQTRTVADEYDSGGSSSGALTKLSADYNSNWPLRSLIQVIPYLGGSLDMLLSGTGANYQYRRIEDFVRELQERLTGLERTLTIEDVQPSEPLYDYIMRVFDGVRRSRSSEKRRRFVNLVTRQISNQSSSWDEAEAAASLLDSLSELQVQILVYAQRVSPCAAIGGDHRVFTLAENPFGAPKDAAPKLQTAFSTVQALALRAACSELIARGLLYDEGIGRLDVKAQEYFKVTDFADWFIDWISE